MLHTPYSRLCPGQGGKILPGEIRAFVRREVWGTCDAIDILCIKRHMYIEYNRPYGPSDTRRRVKTRIHCSENDGPEYIVKNL